MCWEPCLAMHGLGLRVYDLGLGFKFTPYTEMLVSSAVIHSL